MIAVVPFSLCAVNLAAQIVISESSMAELHMRSLADNETELTGSGELITVIVRELTGFKLRY